MLHNIHRTHVSTGRAAILAGIGKTAIIKWCDNGDLECFRVPGSKMYHRRVSVASLHALMVSLGIMTAAAKIEAIYPDVMATPTPAETKE